MTPSPLSPARPRVSVDLSNQVSTLLDQVCEITGATKSQLINSALLDALPKLLEGAEVLQKRYTNITQQQAQNKRK
jgi:hypothetical protein